MKNSIRRIELTAHKVPEFKEERSKDWVIFGTSDGWKNQYPDYLLSLYNRSAKHNAIINGKVDYITGGGFALDSEGLTELQKAEAQKFIKSPNKGETLNDILDKCALDLEIYNGILLEVIYNKTLKKIASIHCVDLTKYRRGKEGGWWYSKEGWAKSKPKDLEFIPDFDYDNPNGKQILYIGEYNPTSDVYPLPTYIGSIPYIEIDVEIANFHLNSIKNGFVGGTVVSFFDGVPSEEEKAEIEERVYSKFAGTDNANSILINFSRGRESGGVDIQQLSGNDLDKRFDLLNKQVQQEIFSGHRVTDPNLFGIKQDGIFATRNQLVDSYELFKNTYIQGRQQFLERLFNGLLELQGLSGRLTIQETAPISTQLSEATVVSVMTTDEIREKAGLEPLTDEQMRKQERFDKADEYDELKIVDSFKTCGLKLTDFEIVDSRGFRFESDTDAEKREEELKKYGFIDTAFEMAVLDAIRENPLITYSEIAASLSVNLDRILEAISSLSESGYLTQATEIIEDASQRALNITPEGERALTETAPLEAEFKIAYRYVLAGGVSGDEIIDTTRDFCREMVRLSKSRVWTLKEIQDIGLRENRNVWLRKGGFWTRKGTNITTPYCRHQWEQITIKAKR